MKDNYNFNFEIYTNEAGKKYIWIGGENGTGAEYPVNNFKEIGEAIAFYLENYYPNLIK